MLLATTACSPYAHRAPVESFATAVTNLAQGIQEGSAAVEADRIALLRLSLEDDRVQVSREGNCTDTAQAGQPPCHLIAVGQTTIRNEVWQQDLQSARGLQALERYAASLMAITNAADRDELDKASGGLVSNVGALATASGVGAPYAAPAQAVASAALWLVGQGLDHERYVRLRRAVREADPYVRIIAGALGEEILQLHGRRIALLSRMSGRLIDGIPATPAGSARLARFDQTARATPALAAVQRGNPADVAQRMAAAHAAVLASLEDPSAIASDGLDAVRAFAEQAAALKVALGTRTSP